MGRQTGQIWVKYGSNIVYTGSIQGHIGSGTLYTGSWRYQGGYPIYRVLEVPGRVPRRYPYQEVPWRYQGGYPYQEVPWRYQGGTGRPPGRVLGGTGRPPGRVLGGQDGHVQGPGRPGRPCTGSWRLPGSQMRPPGGLPDSVLLRSEAEAVRSCSAAPAARPAGTREEREGWCTPYIGPYRAIYRAI